MSDTPLAPDRADRLRAFIARATAIERPSLVPKLRAHLAGEITPIWAMTEEALQREGLPPPFWAFAWAGGQAMARHVLDTPDLAAGRRVLCVGCGGGLEAIAAARAGAAQVWANDLDPVALIAAQMNAALNSAALTLLPGDLTVGGAPEADLVLAADAFYEVAASRRMLDWLRGLARGGAQVLAADAGRGFLPTEGLEAVARHEAPTLRALEDRDSRLVTIWRVPPD
jgi:predicted nicotinamide N-methyase